jgi:hypothetical protein
MWPSRKHRGNFNEIVHNWFRLTIGSRSRKVQNRCAQVDQRCLHHNRAPARQYEWSEYGREITRAVSFSPTLSSNGIPLESQVVSRWFYMQILRLFISRANLAMTGGTNEDCAFRSMIMSSNSSNAELRSQRTVQVLRRPVSLSGCDQLMVVLIGRSVSYAVMLKRLCSSDESPRSSLKSILQMETRSIVTLNFRGYYADDLRSEV